MESSPPPLVVPPGEGGSPQPATEAAPAFIPFEQFWHEHFAPRFEQDLGREQQWHDEAFAATTLTLCGIEVRGATPYDLLLLHGCGNPLVAGGPVHPAHLRQFFALLADPAPQGWLARRRLHRHLDGLPYRETVRAIRTYLDRMFACADLSSPAAQAPSSEPPSSDSPTQASPVAMSFLAPLVIELAAGTGWTEEAILSMRLDKLFQYRRALRMREGKQTAGYRCRALLSRALQAHTHYLATGELPDPAAPSSA